MPVPICAYCGPGHETANCPNKPAALADAIAALADAHDEVRAQL
jgi:hypothetical protein